MSESERKEASTTATTPLIQVGTVASPKMLGGDFEERHALIHRVADSGIDHVFGADHVSFINGSGMDGLMNAAMISAIHPTLKVCIGVYLLALRHPLPVARQLATIAQSAPGRVILGIGVGGEDRHEMEVCGIDPKTRGRRTNECLEIIRALGTGEPLNYSGEFFELENALIKPAIKPVIPIVVGGRADAAIKRAGLYSEGWLGVWCSANRFEAAIAEVEAIAEQAGRQDIQWQHGLQVWAGVHRDKGQAKALIAKEMEAFYKVPFSAFEKYSPYGHAQEIAEFLIPYAEKGCQLFNIKPCAESDNEGIDAVAAVRERLLRG